MRRILAVLVASLLPAVASGSPPAPPAQAAPAAPAAMAAPAAAAARAAPAAPPAGYVQGQGGEGGEGGAAGAAGGGAATARSSSSKTKAAAVSVSEPAAIVSPGECDLCIARTAYLKAGRVKSTGLDNGVVLVSTGNANKLEAAAAEMDKQLKAAADGTAKLDEGCVAFVRNVGSGKIKLGHGRTPNGHAWTAMSSDPNLALEVMDWMEKTVVPAKKGGKK